MVEEGLKILAALRARYNGKRRNPYNETECGDHYSRAMAGWSVLDALSGFRYNALTDALAFAPAGEPKDELRVPFITRDGWGTFASCHTEPGWKIHLTCAFGQLQIRRLTLAHTIAAARGDELLACETLHQNNASTIIFAEPLILTANTTLSVSLLV